MEMHPKFAELLNYFEEQRNVLDRAFHAVPTALREQPPAPGRWSAAGIVEHLSITEARIVAALTGLLERAKADGLEAETSTDPTLPAFDVGPVLDREKKIAGPRSMGPTGLSADAAWEALERSAVAVREFIGTADGLAIGTLSMPHPAFGSMSGYEWLAFIAAHEARHADQIREVREALTSA